MKQKIVLITTTCALGLFLIGLLLTGISPQAALAQSEPPDHSTPQACALLDDAQARGLMSGAFEIKLLIQCGRLIQPERQPTGLLKHIFGLTQTDVSVNDPTTDVLTSTTQSETSIAVNPNTGTICSAYYDSQHYAVGSIGFVGFSSSTDDGATFVDHGPIPNGGNGFAFGNPSLVWRQSDSKFYLAALHSNGLGLWRSYDDCDSMVYNSLIHTSIGDDKELMAVDNNPASPYYGRLYVAWTDFNAGAQIYVTYSDDTTTWSTPVAVSAVGVEVHGAWPAVDPVTNDVYVAWVRWNPFYTGPIDIEIVRSTDGGASFTAVTNPLTGGVNPYDNTATTTCSRPALNEDIHYLPTPQITVGPDSTLHVVYSYDPDGNGTGDVINVYYRRSTDHGASWGPEIQLNDDATQTDQWFPTISISPNNVIVATWYDRRLDAASNSMFDYYKSISYDGGLNWEPNTRVSDVSSSVPTLAPNFDPAVVDCYHGTYDQQVQHNSYAYIQWSDDRNIQNAHPDPDIWFEKERVFPEIGWLEGTIYDADTLAPIAGAHVKAVADLTFYAVSENDGSYDMLATPNTYVVTGTAFGYLPNSIAGVTIISGTTTTQDISLTPVPHYTVEGVVTDAAAGWPLYASIDTHSPAGVVWTDPETGYYSISLPEGIAYDFEVAAWVPGYIPSTPVVGPLTANVTLNFALDANLATCVAPGYQKTYAFFDDFESGYANWTTSGLWNPEAEGDTCGSLVAPFPSPSNAVYYGIDSTCTYNTGLATSGELTLTLPVSLPASGSVLEFSSFEETECNGNCVYDNRYVDIGVVTTTTTWITLGEGDTEDSWYQKSFDLSAYGGDNILLRFRFDSVDSIGNNYFGWMVDNVGIKVDCAPPSTGGLVVGNIYNQNSLDPVVGAEVSNDTGEVTLALPTPDDPNVDDAFYTLFSPEGDHSFTATHILPYNPAVETVTVLDGDVVRQDFFLPAPAIVPDPEVLEAWLINGTTVLTHPVGLDIINNGSASSDFEISEISGTVSLAAGVLSSDYFSVTGVGYPSGSEVDRRETITPSRYPAATAGCLVAVTRNNGGPNETPYLHATLDELGFSWIDINTVQDARDAGANVIIDRYAAINLPFSDLNDWLNDGFGYVELGDWPAWFPDASEGQPAGTPLSIEVADSTHPLAKGLPATWIGRGFWAYDWSSDALGWVDSTAYPNIVQAQYDTLRKRVVSAEEVGPGHAAYIGINTYGPLAGDPDKQVLQNAIEWTGQCRFDVPWLWEDPFTGTVPAEDTFNLDIMFTALYPDMVTPMPLGTYTATLRIENNAPFAETQYVPVMMHIIEAFSDPVASFTSNSPVTLGTSVVFTNTSTEGLPPTEYYLWDFGDGQTLQVSNTDPINHDYALPGVYTVTLTAHQAQTGVEAVYTDTVLVMGYIYMPLITKNY